MAENNFINQEEKKTSWETRIVQLKRVAHTRAGGKKIRFRATVAGGNRQGKVGIGIASANDVSEAISKASRLSEKRAIEVPLVNQTIPYEIKTKFKNIVIILKPRKKGQGLRVGTTVKLICELAGIKDLSVKKIGKTSNKMNIAQAMLEALKKIRLKNK
ncbi:MAG: 30S ribosomal protein S5 [Minisyncoccales bacterium]